MEDFKYCRACLAVDVKMYSFNAMMNVSIGDIYSQLTQLSIYEENQYLCYECAGLLYKYHKFKSKCHRADNILAGIKVGIRQITKQDIQNVNRKQNQLKSSLMFSPIKTCYKDPSDYSGNDERNLIKVEIPPEEVKIKIETEINDTDVFRKVETLNETPNEKKLSITKSKPKSKTNIEPKTRKRKVQKKISSSDDDHSDDEPLSKCTKTNEKTKEKKQNGLNISYFEDYATVEFLTTDDARKEVLLRKESNNYKKSPFKCDKCYRGYEAKAAFENHMKKHSIEYGEFECELCQLRFPQQAYLCKHRLTSHKRKFSCKLCPYVCYCTYQAKTHVRLHKGKKYPCKDCGEIFSMPNSLLMHKRVKHLKESVRESVCEHCGSTFGTPRGLFLHNMKVHRQDKNDKQGPECDKCGLHFSTELAWKRHLVISIKHKVSNGCKACGETFSSSEELKSHMRLHSRTHRIQCESIKLPAACAICNKWLHDRVEYKSHMTSEHPLSDEANKFNAEDSTPFVCEVCGQMFKQQCFLTYHQRKHTGERPFKCLECGKTFQQAGALSIHSSVHTRKRTFKCDMCGRIFTFKSSLNKHIKIHLGIRPHKCAICEKGFIHMCDLRMHIKYVHDKVPWPKKKAKREIAEQNAQFLDYN